jgi:hypothetical protein
VHAAVQAIYQFATTSNNYAQTVTYQSAHQRRGRYAIGNTHIDTCMFDKPGSIAHVR